MTAAQLAKLAEPLHLVVVSRELVEDLEGRSVAERRATVERIRKAAGYLPEYDGDCLPVMEGMSRLLQALDAEEAR
jgi:hypothetical protein